MTITMMVIEVVCDDCVNFLEDIPILSPIPRELQANILLNIKTIENFEWNVNLSSAQLRVSH